MGSVTMNHDLVLLLLVILLLLCALGLRVGLRVRNLQPRQFGVPASAGPSRFNRLKAGLQTNPGSWKALFLGVVALFFLLPRASAENWPGWRGPRGDGTSLETNTPMHWNSASNVIWKVEIPGIGHASPIVW